jgi:hypothetical protein
MCLIACAHHASCLIVYKTIIVCNFFLIRRSEFLKVEEELNIAKERDKEQYYNILERLRDMYRESVGVCIISALLYFNMIISSVSIN